MRNERKRSQRAADMADADHADYYPPHSGLSWKAWAMIMAGLALLGLGVIVVHFAWPVLALLGPVFGYAIGGAVVFCIVVAPFIAVWWLIGEKEIRSLHARRWEPNEHNAFPVLVKKDQSGFHHPEHAQLPMSVPQTLTLHQQNDGAMARMLEHLIKNNQQQQQALPPTTVQEVKSPVPTGRQLLKSGAVEHELAQGKIILGPKEDGTMATLPIKRCFSSLISGIPSVGKSTTVFWIAGQLVIVGAKLWIVDPHLHYQSEDGERSLGAELDALSDSFVFEVCDDNQQHVLSRVKYMFNELLRRERPGYIVRAKDTIIGIMDEFNTVAAGFDQRQSIVTYKGQNLNFSQTISLIEREGRKFGLHFMLIGHRWADRDIGGDSAVRTNATTYLCHRMNDQGQADLLLGKGFGKKILQLGVGEYWITGSSWREEAQTKLVTPMISAVDLPLILTIKQRGVVVSNQANVIESTVSTPMSTVVSEDMSALPSGHTSGHNTDALVKPVDMTLADAPLPAEIHQKMHMVLDLDGQGDVSQNEIIRQVWGVDPQARQGREAANELRQIRSYIAAQMKRGM